MGLFPKNRDLRVAPQRVELSVNASNLRMRAEDVLIRLDAFLVHHLTWRSRASIQDLIRTGHVLVDASTPDRPRGGAEPVIELRPGRRLRNGSRVVVLIPEELRLPMLEPHSDEVAILYEDEAVLAVDKPAFVVVHPSGRYLTDTLIQRVHAKYGGDQELERGDAPRLCHRLDRETSGIVLIAKVPQAHSFLMGQFERREVEKEYLTIVHGAPQADSGMIDYPIGSSRASAVGLKMTIAADGQPAATHWRVRERFADTTLLSCFPVSGRQHQIRVHLAAQGLPVVGDKLYGADEELFQRSLDDALTHADLEMLGMPRHALHNHRVVFRSPAAEEPVEVTSPMPDDMRRFLAAQSR